MSLARDHLLDFLYREARLLDDRQWDDWLACYSPKAEFWMPAWDDHDTLTEDPQREISLIYYTEFSRVGQYTINFFVSVLLFGTGR